MVGIKVIKVYVFSLNTEILQQQQQVKVLYDD